MTILGPQVGYSLYELSPEEIVGRLYRRSLTGGGTVRHTPLNPEPHGLQGDVPGTQARRGMFGVPLWMQAPQLTDVEPSLNRPRYSEVRSCIYLANHHFHSYHPPRFWHIFFLTALLIPPT
jgi:hypothetical protein